MFNRGNPETALHCAARWAWEDMVRLLIEKGANTEIVESGKGGRGDFGEVDYGKHSFVNLCENAH